jgi:glycine cleavage system H protein
MTIDAKARYSKTDEWVRKEGDLVVYGISDHAQEALSDVVFIDLPEVGASFSKGDVVGVVESVKAASDLILPISGTIVEVNEGLSASPEILNTDPYAQGWMIKIKPTHPTEWDELLTAEAYAQLLGEKG